MSFQSFGLDDASSVYSSRMDDIETESYVGSLATVEPSNQNVDVYDNYNFEPCYDQNLPIAKFREQVKRDIWCIILSLIYDPCYSWLLNCHKKRSQVIECILKDIYESIDI